MANRYVVLLRFFGVCNPFVAEKWRCSKGYNWLGWRGFGCWEFSFDSEVVVNNWRGGKTSSVVG